LRIRVHAGRVEEREIELRDGSNYYDLLGELKLNPETVVIFRDGVPVSFDAPVSAGRIDVLRVVSGG
jgi:sulfur carrier protein